jgi:rhodanese-related sulfurtransferase
MKNATVTELATTPDRTVIDVREDFEYSAGHAPGAVNIPLHQLRTRLDDLRELSPVYIICQSGGRSAQATAALTSVGVEAINVEGGTSAWISAGLPVETL